MLSIVVSLLILSSSPCSKERDLVPLKFKQDGRIILPLTLNERDAGVGRWKYKRDVGKTAKSA